MPVGADVGIQKTPGTQNTVNITMYSVLCLLITGIDFKIPQEVQY